jgi:hypothetical protein
MKPDNFKKFLVFKDEENTKFLLLNFCAIYLNCNSKRCEENKKLHQEILVPVQLWSKKHLDILLKNNIIKDDVHKQDNGVYDFCIEEKYIKHLLLLNEYNSPKNYKKSWIENKKEKLGHDIIRNYKI